MKWVSWTLPTPLQTLCVCVFACVHAVFECVCVVCMRACLGGGTHVKHGCKQLSWPSHLNDAEVECLALICSSFCSLSIGKLLRLKCSPVSYLHEVWDVAT